MIVPTRQWKLAIKNLVKIRNRKKRDKRKPKDKDFYSRCLKNVFIGKSVLDVGCGAKQIERCLDKYVKYVGIDPLPLYNDVIKTTIEDADFQLRSFDTVIAFASLDYSINLELAIKKIGDIASCNVIILTGLDIPVDKNHTQCITMKDLASGLQNFDLVYKEEIKPKVYLLEWRRKNVS
jgi:SAM-dependent methyltransferase